jgi:EAL domain-containing protein (putative c-di-GMP-specific phosphodiesterase class I)
MSVIPDTIGVESEKALYILELMDNEIKKSNKNYLIYDKRIEDKVYQNDASIMKIIRSVIEEDVQILCQGVHRAGASGKTQSFEILSRLHVDSNALSPQSYIPTLIDNNYIVRYDQIVLKKALAKAHGLLKDDVEFVSINLTTQDLLAHGFITNVKTQIAQSKLNPNQVAFEINEDALTKNYGVVKSIIQELGQFGVKFILDHFGVSYSNMNNVFSLPFYMIKLDRVLLVNARENDQNKMIIKNIVASIKNANMLSCVEGIETTDDLEILKMSKAEYGQGYYYDKPIEISARTDEDSIKNMLDANDLQSRLKSV